LLDHLTLAHCPADRPGLFCMLIVPSNHRLVQPSIVWRRGATRILNTFGSCTAARPYNGHTPPQGYPGILSGRLPADSVAEAHLLVVLSARVMREERGLQLCLECCGVVTQDTLRTK